MPANNNPDSVTVDVRSNFLDSQPREQYLGPHGVLRFFRNVHGSRLAAYYWPATSPAKGVVLICHGHGTYLCFDYLQYTVGAEPHKATNMGTHTVLLLSMCTYGP